MDPRKKDEEKKEEKSLASNFSTYLNSGSTKGNRHKKVLKVRLDAGLQIKGKVGYVNSSDIKRVFDDIEVSDLAFLTTPDNFKIFTQLLESRKETKSSDALFQDLVNKATTVILTPEGKLRPDIIYFLIKEDPTFRDKYNSLSPKDQVTFKDSLIHSLAHAAFTLFNVQYSGQLIQDNKPLDDTIPLFFMDTVPKAIDNAIEINKEFRQKTIKTLERHLDNSISSQIGKPNSLSPQQLEEEATRINRVYGLGIPEPKSGSKSSMQDLLLEKIKRDYPGVADRIVAKWDKTDFSLFEKEKVNAVLNKTVPEEKKKPPQPTAPRPRPK